MSGEAKPQIPPMPSSLSMIRTLGLIAMISGLLVVLVARYTEPIIKEKERRALEQAVFQVIPEADKAMSTRVSFALSEDGLVRLDEETGINEANLYAVYDESGILMGIALQGAAQGYQDVVRTLYGYDPKCECIVGLVIMKSTDTPGMGDKNTVEGNKQFMANFDGLSVQLAADNNQLAHAVETVKHGTKTGIWQVDAISGATITSRAIGRGLNQSARKMLPLIARHLDVLKVNN
jgi:electron transport complex protein RnfG